MLGEGWRKLGRRKSVVRRRSARARRASEGGKREARSARPASLSMSEGDFSSRRVMDSSKLRVWAESAWLFIVTAGVVPVWWW